MSHTQTLAWLDKLRTLSEAQRTQELQRLLNVDAGLHEQLMELLSSSGTAHDASGSPAALAQSGTALGGYRLIRELGRGGMSVVWLAERADGVPKRQVALKLPSLALTSSIDIERFNRERDVLAALEHPNIARLYDAGVTDAGQPFMALEYVDGLPITAYCDRERASVRLRLQLFLQMTAAVEHAHAHLVVHRDLKPSNVLVDTHGQVRLLDFGIAKLLPGGDAAGAATELTQDGRSVLTPRYAAPEQVAREPISTATDIYLLGLVLYELLTGVLPHMRAERPPQSMATMLQAILSDQTVRPSRASMDEQAAQLRGFGIAARLRAALGGDLDTIVLKALRRQASDRYASVERLADDIRRFMAHEPIKARAPSLQHRLRLFLRRNRAAAVATCLGVVAAAAIGGVALRNHQQAVENAARTTAVRNFIFDLVNDAEPDETDPQSEVTGRQMVHGAVRRARLEFQQQPRLRGELLGELGRMLTRLGDSAGAQQVLTEALSLLTQHAPGDDPALNKTRAHLADLLLDDGEVDGAFGLASAAGSACTLEDAECFKARAYANVVLSKVAMNRGQTQQALEAMRASVRQFEHGFGAEHVETAMAYVSLAVVARNVGRLSEAEAAAARAEALSERKTLSAADRSMMRQTRALLEIDLGHYASAQRLLTELLSGTRDAEARALQGRLLANTLLLQGEAVEALRIAEAAIQDAIQAKDSAEVLFTRLARARALSLLAHYDEARGEFDAVIDGLMRAGRSANSLAVIRARRARAEMLARAGRFEEASAQLQELTALSVEQADAMELMACVLRARAEADKSLVLHRRARGLLEQNLPQDHPFLLRNTLYQEAAVANIELTEQSRRQLVRTAERVKQQFGPTSVWRSLIEQCERNPPCAIIL